jgi:pyruvate, orthophosphate dikinase
MVRRVSIVHVDKKAKASEPWLGAKAQGLVIMARLGLPVPPGFAVASDLNPGKDELAKAVRRIGKNFGNAADPLLLAVRQSPQHAALGVKASILYVGLNDKTVEGLAHKLGDAEAAYATYKALLEFYGVTVCGLRHSQFDDGGLPAKDAVERCKQTIAERAGRPFPQDVITQLKDFITALAAPRSAIIVQEVVRSDDAPVIIESRNMSTGAPHDQPKLGKELAAGLARVERHYKSIQQVTYTLSKGKLWFLKTLPAKVSARVELKHIVDMVGENTLTKRQALLLIDPVMLDQFLHPTLEPGEHEMLFAAGLAASPGAVSGHIAFDAGEAQSMKAVGKSVILFRHETSPEDIQGMHAADGVATVRGGLLSHAAVIARGMGKPCVVGATTLRIDEQARLMSSQGISVKAGDTVTLDGATGRIYLGAIPTVKPILSGDFATVLEWADQFRRMKVRANAETPADARAARYFGAEGIGLCRTEHMFFSAERIRPIRRMILAETQGDRARALAEILPLQRQDFVELFEIMAGLPVTIRLLDPPLHEFLPKSEHEIVAVAHEMGMETDFLRTRVAELQEFNPMLGHRGVRLAVSYPEIAEMQAQAIFEATVEVAKKYGKAPIPEIMIPLVFGRPELDLVRARIVTVAEEVQAASGFELHYLIGTMIELPRAALRAGEIAQSADFFSFGTNDLTQTTLGISRDDSTRFIAEYTAKGLLKIDPFVTIDVEGVGELVRIATDRGRKARPNLKLGICGEHAGDPASIAFCEKIKLDYVSCSPFRMAVARLAAAQATIRNR